MFGRLLERFIRKRATEVVSVIVSLRNRLNENGVEVTPRSIFEELSGHELETIENSVEPEHPRRKMITSCMLSFEGIAYYIEMVATRSLGDLIVQRYWSYCMYVDEMIRDAGFPTQSKETKERIFQALEIDKGNYRNHL